MCQCRGWEHIRSSLWISFWERRIEILHSGVFYTLLLWYTETRSSIMSCHCSIDGFDTCPFLVTLCIIYFYDCYFIGDRTMKIPTGITMDHSLFQEECLQRLQNRIEVQYDNSNLEHQVWALADIRTLLVQACIITEMQFFPLLLLNVLWWALVSKFKMATGLV
jgi:hypothetical protein